jgi:hypothetical protein
MRVLIAVATSTVLLAGCGGGATATGDTAKRSGRLVDFSQKPPYVNAHDVDPGTGDFLLTTNRGFFRIDAKTHAVARVHATMTASRHLALSDGTIVSTEDGGRGWKTTFRP